MSLRIGITERGDAGLDLSWVEACRARKVDGCIAITKNLNPEVRKAILELSKDGFPLIVHVTCTGYGQTVVERNVPKAEAQIFYARKLIDAGFPAEKMVFRVDPIFPTEKGIQRAVNAINSAILLGVLPEARCRISILDEYKHVKERFKKAGLPTVYPDNQFTAGEKEYKMVAEALSQFDLTYETCAEPFLSKFAENPNQFIQQGCVSLKDIELMGLKPDPDMIVNPQNRKGCTCLSCKTELLTAKKPCKHGCMYCYWR